VGGYQSAGRESVERDKRAMRTEETREKKVEKGRERDAEGRKRCRRGEKKREGVKEERNMRNREWRR
jgi:hypothetical protein